MKQMRIPTFYRCATLLPLCLPLLLLPGYLRSHPLGSPSVFSTSNDYGPDRTTNELFLCLMYAAIPYVTALALHYKILRGNDARIQRRLIWTLPLRTLPVLLVYVVVYALFDYHSRQQAMIIPLPIAIMFCYVVQATTTLMLGYFCVLITQFSLWVLQRLGQVEPLPSDFLVPELRSYRSRFTEISGR